MSDQLPSPDRMKPLAERLRSHVDKGYAEALVEEIVVTIEARASGRLVDREAIHTNYNTGEACYCDNTPECFEGDPPTIHPEANGTG